MKRHLMTTAAALGAALVLPVAGATGATGAPAATGKSSIYNCTNRTITSDRHQMSVTCDTPGRSYRFEVLCDWYSAGRGGTFWRSSAWTSDNRRAAVNCGGGAYVSGVGGTVFWRS